MTDTVFLRTLDMSIAASGVIVAVLGFRLLLRRAPRAFSYALWAVVLFRLVCPFSFESTASLLRAAPSVQQYALQPDIAKTVTFTESAFAVYRAVGDAANGGIGTVLVRTEADFGQQTVTASHAQVWLLFAKYVWLLGIVTLCMYSAASLWRLRKQLTGAVRLRDNIFLADGIASPFVVGVAVAKIYLPSSLPAAQQPYIIMHEQTHLKRQDHLVKLAAFCALVLHWFNPLVWVAYFCAMQDMELSCDESVLRNASGDIRAEYAALLLGLATGRRRAAAMPPGFGEGSTKARIKNALRYHKPAKILLLAAAMLVLVATVALAANPLAPKDNGITRLHTLHTPYVGNNSAVGNIINSLPPMGNGYTQQFFAIGKDYGTQTAPYTLTVYYERTAQAQPDAKLPLQQMAVLLFASIDNLQEVTFAFRETASDGALDEHAYAVAPAIARSEDYLRTKGLTWESFTADWNAAVERLLAPEGALAAAAQLSE